MYLYSPAVPPSAWPDAQLPLSLNLDLINRHFSGLVDVEHGALRLLSTTGGVAFTAVGFAGSNARVRPKGFSNVVFLTHAAMYCIAVLLSQQE